MKKIINTLITYMTALSFMLLLSTSMLAQSKIYFVNQVGELISSDIDGSNLQVVTSGLGQGGKITYDAVNQKLYFTVRGADQIKRCNLDGTNVETLITDSGLPFGIAVDPIAGYIFYGNEGQLKRANLDGSGLITILNVPSAILGVAVDPATQKVYYGSTGGGFIARADYDGANAEQLITGLFFPDGLTLDLKNKKIVFIDELRFIGRADLDGSNLETVIDNIPGYDGVDVACTPSGKIIWSHDNVDEILSADSDGSNIQVIITGQDAGGLVVTGNPLGSEPIPIPTMGEWALLLLGLVVTTLGVVSIYNARQLQLL